MMIAVAASFAWNEYLALFRAKFPFVWFLVLPAVASAILGPAVAGLEADGATGRVLIGFAVMFSYMTVNYVGRALYREYDANTWRRTAIAAPSRWGYLLGKCTPVYSIGVGQLTAFALFAVVALDLPLQAGTVEGVLQVEMVVLPLAATGVATGVLLFTCLGRAEVFFSLTYLVLMVLAAVGGALVPTDQLPGWSQAVGPMTPHFWAMRSLDEATLGGGSWAVALQGSFALTVFAVAIGTAATRRLEIRRECFAV